MTRVASHPSSKMVLPKCEASHRTRRNNGTLRLSACTLATPGNPYILPRDARYCGFLIIWVIYVWVGVAHYMRRERWMKEPHTPPFIERRGDDGYGCYGVLWHRYSTVTSWRERILGPLASAGVGQGKGRSL